MEISILILSLLVGFGAGWLWAGRKTAVLRTDLSTCRKEMELYREISQEKMELLERTHKEIMDKERTIVENRLAEERSNSEKRLADLRSGFEQRLTERQKEIERLHQQMKTEFENISNRIFKEKTEDFKVLNAEQLQILLGPLGENLKEFHAKVDQVYEKESKQRFSLEERIKELVELNQKISEEANNLTRALKGDSKAQGNWGEMILERILQASGLIEGEHYFRQEFLKDEAGIPCVHEETGQKMQPDILVKYPGDREMIIDSKVSLTAYTAFSSAEEESEKKLHLKAHLQSLRNHIDELSRKDYSRYCQQSPEFVMMFIPTESAYLVAVKSDMRLWEYAYNKKVVLMSPTNLITALRLALDLWKREYQVKNIQAIVERGTSLYDKFVGFTETFLKVGDTINSVQKEYEKALGQLSTGRGNLVRQAEQLRGMSLTPKKNLPPRLLLEQEEDGSDS